VAKDRDTLIAELEQEREQYSQEIQRLEKKLVSKTNECE